jgi:biopolymer transport protein ExbD
MLGDKELKLSELPVSLKNTKEIQLHADKSLPYGFVVKVMGVLKSHGVDNISLVTEAGGDSLD